MNKSGPMLPCTRQGTENHVAALTDSDTTTFSSARRSAEAYRKRPPVCTTYAKGLPSVPGVKRAWLCSLYLCQAKDKERVSENRVHEAGRLAIKCAILP